MWAPRFRKRIYWASGLLLSTAMAVYCGLILMKEAIDWFYTPLEYKNKPIPIGQKVRLGGYVLPGSIKKSLQHDTLRTEFVVTDFKEKVAVSYGGIPPDLFREGQGVVVAGRFRDKHRFEADTLFAKHDEKYRPPLSEEYARLAPKEELSP